MSQTSGIPPMELGAGMQFAFPPDTNKSEEDMAKTILGLHTSLKDSVLQLVTGKFSIFQPPDNRADAGRPVAFMSGTSPRPPFFQPKVFYNNGFPDVSQRVQPSARLINFQFMDHLPGFVQNTVSFMLSELYCEFEQTKQRNFQRRDLMRKHYAYLVHCRLAAEKEKKTAQDLLSKAIGALRAAEEEREKCTNERVMALQDLRFCIRRRQSNLRAEVFISKSASTSSLVSTSSSRSSLSSAGDLLLVPANHKHYLLTPPRTPSNGDTECGSELTGNPTTSTSHSEQSALPDTTFKETDETSPNDVIMTFQSAKGDTLQNPIGPYMRPPMSIEDIQKCIRCLLGKDKSLKTGNRARAFLGVPWSVIVSWDPEVLLQRGVCGIKAGSTGMASRLRMMTIIESALANQGNDTFTEEIWEQPTHFCERCQQRYPITVRSDAVVPTEDDFASDFQVPPSSTVTDKLDMDKMNMRVRNKKPHRKRLCLA